MRRRRLLQSLAALPATAAVPRPALGQAPVTAAPAPEKLKTVSPDTVAETPLTFFTPEQFAALQSLGDRLVPAAGGNPGAKEAGAAQFLDFLLSQSPTVRQTLYRNGVNRLNQDSMKRYGKPFAGLTAEQADGVLSPIKATWTYAGPTDAFAQFLLAAKQDFLEATVNSREWSTSPNRGRGGSGMGMYWHALE